jgi:hypothetical protein
VDPPLVARDYDPRTDNQNRRGLNDPHLGVEIERRRSQTVNSMGVVVSRGNGKTMRGTYLPERRRRPAHQKGHGNGVGHRAIGLLVAARRGRHGCGEGIKGRYVVRAVSWWLGRRLLVLGERVGD